MRKLVIYDNGFKYEGEWNIETNEIDGNGVFIWPDGSVYEGYRKNGKSEGKGRCIHHSGKEYYIGDYKENKQHGNGIY